MPTVAYHAEARADIAAIKAVDPKAIARIVAVLDQVKVDADLLDRLTQHNFGASGTADFHVSRWTSQQNKYSRNLWRLKVWDLENQKIRYRVVYAFDPASLSVFVLGITPRKEFNYEDGEPFTNRVVACYDRHFGGS